MSKASLNYFQAFHVGKVKTDVIQFTTIQAAIDIITDNTSSKRYCVYVHPGIYDERVTMEDYVDVIATGGREETVITHTCAGHDEVTVTAENALIKGFTIVSDGATGTLRARCVNAATAGFEMEDCILTPQNTAAAAICLNATASCDIKDCVVDSAAASATGAVFTTNAQTYNVLRTSFNAGTNAIETGGGPTSPTLNLEDCTVSTNLRQDGGTVNIKRCSMEAVALGVTACTLTAELSRFTSTFSTAQAVVHTITCHNCSFSGQNFTNAATGATVITLRGCDGIATLTNAGVAGTLTLYETGVDTLTTTQGTVVAYGGRIGACGGSTGTSFVWYRAATEIRVLLNMKIAHALAVAAANSAVILGAGTFAESNLSIPTTVTVRGEGNRTIISINDANPVFTIGASVCVIKDMAITQAGAGKCLSITNAGANVTLYEVVLTAAGGQDAIAMTAGTCSLSVVGIVEGDIDLSTAACTLNMDLCQFVGSGDIDIAGAFAHTISLSYCSMGGRSIVNGATGATTIDIRYCSLIGTFSDAGLVGTTFIENTVIVTAAKTGTSPWTVYIARFGDISNTNAVGGISIYGGYIDSCSSSVGSVVFRQPEGNLFTVVSGMKVAHALAAANSGDVIRIGPGTYAENLTMKASVHLVGDDRTQCVIEKNDGANPIIASAVAGVEIRTLTISNTNAGQAGLAVSANTLQIWDCTISGAASSIAMTGGTLAITNSTLSPGVVALSTAICTLNLRYCRVTGGDPTTAGAFAHVMTFEHCEFGGSAITSNATAATTLALRNCTNVGAITNAGTGAFTIRESGVSSINGTGAGANTFYGGYLGRVTRAVGATVWWKNDSELWVLPSATTTDPMVASALAAATSGDVVHIGKGTFTESGLLPKNNVDIVGEGKGISSIQVADGANPIIAVGTGVTLRIHSLSISNMGANNAINLAAVAGNAVVYLTDCYVGGTNGVSLNTTGAGLCGLYCIDTEFSITTTAIIVAGAVVHTVDVKNCTFVCTNVITLTGANHTFDAVDCECGGGAVTVAANVPPINMTRCNDVGAITNLTNALTLEHCTTGAITNTTGTVVIEHCNTDSLNSSGAATVTITASTLGALTQGAAAGTINVYDSTMGDISTGAAGTVRLYGGCYFTDIAANAGVLTWKVDPNHIKVVSGTANMKIANALTLSVSGDIIQVMPGTYAESNLTLKASVNLVGTDADQCSIVASDAANPILAAAVTCTISNLTVGNTNAGAPAIAVTTNTLTVRDCYIYGTAAGDAITMVAGTLTAYETRVGAGDINLSTAICTLSMYQCLITTDPVDTTGAFAHVLTFVACDFGAQNLASLATGATTLAMRNCTNVGAITNAGTGAFTIRESGVSSINGTGAGANTFYGGYLGTVTRAVGATVWWKNDNELWVLPSATTTDPMVASALTAAASGDVVHIGKGTFAESNLTAKNNVDIVGEGKGISAIQVADGANPIIAVGAGVTLRIHSLSISNMGANNAIKLAAVAGNAVVYLTDCYVAAGAGQTIIPLNTTGAGLCGLYCIDTEFSVATSAIVVAGAVVHTVDVKNCIFTFTITNVITLTGANHTFDAVDCECGGGTVTVAANVPPINMTRCNDVGAITNLTNALTLEHCTTGAITNTTGTVVIEHCNTGSLNSSGAATVTITASTLGALTQGAAAGTITVTNSSVGVITLGATGTIRLLGGCSFTSVAITGAGVMTWKTAPQVYEVCNGMLIQNAITAAAAETPSDTFRFEVRIHSGQYSEVVTCAQFVDLIGDSAKSCVIQQTNADVITLASNVQIENVTVRVVTPDAARTLIKDNAAACTGVKLSNVVLSITTPGAFADLGVLLSGGSTIVMERCSATWVAGTGAEIVLSVTTAASTVLVDGCNFSNTNTTAGSLINSAFAGTVITVVDSRLGGTVTHLVASAGIIRVSNSQYRSVARSATGNVVDESPELKDSIWHTMKKVWEVITAAVYNARIVGAGTVVLGGAGQLALTITNAAADVAGTESAVDAAGSLQSSYLPAQTPRYMQQISVSAFAAGADGNRQFYGLRETLGGVIPVLAAEECAGFDWDGTNFRAVSSDGVTGQTTNLATPSTGAQHQLEVIVFGGVKVEFYVDGKLVATHSTAAGLPAVLLDWQELIHGLGTGATSAGVVTVRAGGVQESPA